MKTIRPKLILFSLLSMFFLSVSLYGQTDITWESGASDLGATVTSTQLATVTITVSGAGDVIDLAAGGGLGGSSGDVVFTPNGTASSVTVSFSKAVNIVSIFIFDPSGANGETITITPTGGSGNTAKMGTFAAAGGTTVTLNWSGITSFALTGSSAFYGFDLLDDVSITPSNTDPTENANTGSSLNEGATDVISNTELHYDDAEEADTDITYTLDNVPSNGSLRKSSVALTAGGTFTQDDLNNNRIDYVHNGGETTSDSFQFDVSDGAGGAVNNVTFNLTISALNDAPAVGTNTGISVNEGGTEVINNTELNENDPDDSGTGLTYTVTTLPTNGNVQLSSSNLLLNGTFTQDDVDNNRVQYVHNGGETTSDSFVFSLADGGENSAAAVTGQTFNITISALNDAPAVGTNTGITVNEGGTEVINNTELNENDPDDSGTGLTYTVTTLPTNGNVQLSSSNLLLNGTFTQDDLDNNRVQYVHDGGETTSDSFVFSLADGGENSAAALTGQTFNITISALNDAPAVGTNTGISVNEGGTEVVNNTELNENDPDDSGTGLTYTVTTLPTNGNVQLSSSNLLLNGTFTQDDVDNNRVQYVHDGSNTTSDSFVFSLADGGENSAAALTGQTFNITINGLNDPPVVGTNTGISVNEGGTEVINNTELNENDPDDSGTGLTYTVTTLPTNGNVQLSSSNLLLNGTFTQDDIDNNRVQYVHDGGETTSDSFVFSLADGGENSAAAVTGQTFNITISALNDAPAVGTNTGISVNEGGTEVINNTELNENDPDDSGTGLTYTVTTLPTNGNVQLSSSNLLLNGTFTQDDIDNNRVQYVHDGGETTSDSFVFSLADGGENSAAALTGQTFNITISALNDAPALGTNTGISVNEGGTEVINNTELNENDPDDSGTGLTYTVTTLPTNGNVQLSSSNLLLNGTFTQDDIDNNRVQYVHDGGETTSDSFVFSLADGGENSAAAVTGQTFNITISALNDAPAVGTNTGISLNQGATEVINNTELNENDPDDSGTGLTYTVTTLPTNGNVQLSSSNLLLNGTFTQDDIDNNRVQYVHDGSNTTSDSFVFSLADGGENSAAAVTGQTFNITLNDITAPVDPVVTTPATATTVNAASQTISGTHTEDGVVVHAYADSNNDGVADNTTSLGSATVSSNAWSFSVNLTADAANNFVVQARDAAANVSGDVDVPTITEDSTNPANPVVTTPASATTVNAAAQTISGSHTEDGVVVHAYADSNNDGVADNTTSLGSATVSSNAWSFSVNLTADAANNFVVQAADGAGNVSSDVDVPTITEDSSAPTFVSSSPIDDATSVGISDNITITFNENIVFGTGNIQIIDLDDGSGTVTIDVASSGSQVSISTTTLTINPTSDLEAGTNYAVQIASTAILDGFSNGFAGVSDNTTFNFSTADPTVEFGLAIDGQLESEPSQDLPIGLSAKSSKTITVAYAATGTATGGGVDYTFADGTFQFDPGDQNLTLQLTGIIDDLLDEVDETIILTLSNPINATLGGQSTLTYTIQDNDDAPTVTLSVGNSNIAEASGTSTITATLSAVSGKDVDVTLAYTGTATNGTDYNNTASTTITINAGSSSADAAVGLTATQDVVAEGNETIIIDITGVTNGSENGTQQQTVTIIDDDAPTVVNVTSTTTNGSYKEADNIEITVEFSQVVNVTGIPQLTIETGTTDQVLDLIGGTGTTTLTFNYTVQPGDASADLDYTSTSSLALNGGTIKNGSGIDALLDLPSPGASGSLGDNKALIIDTSVPAAPSVTSITTDSGSDGADAITNDNTLAFNGTAEANSTVEVFIGGTSIGTTTADGSGNFSFDHTGTTLSDGAIDVTAKAKDAAGNESTESTSFVVTVDTTTPLAPSVDAISTDTGLASTDFITQDNTIVFSGLTEANAIVEVFLDNTSIGTTTADGAGNWSFDHTATTLSDADYTLTAKATDKAGNTSDSSTAITLTVDNAVPSAPTVSSITTDTGSDGADGTTNDNTLAINGTAETNSTVEVFIGGTSIGTTAADGSGNFSIDHTGTTLADATYSITAKATDAAGNTSAESSTFSSTIDTAAPTSPTVTSITSDSGTDGADGITNDNTLAINGTAEANSSVEVFLNGSSIGTTNADGSGNFSFDHISTTLVDGDYIITAIATDDAGNISSVSTDFALTVDTNAPVAPVVTSVTNDTGTDGADQITSDNTPDVNGTAEANSMVEVFVDGTSVGTTTADGSGNWTMTYNGSSPRADGAFDVTAKATDAAGNTSATSSALSVTVDTAAPDAPVVSTITDDTGANGTDQNTNDATLSFSGTAEADATLEVFIDGTSIGTTTADGAGQWIFNHEGTTLADAVYLVTAKATDAAGNASAESNALSVTVDTVSPGAPTIDLDAAFDTGASDSDDLTNATTLKFNGTAEVNADVEVFINDVSLGVTTADVVGTWTLTTSPLTLRGAISVKAIATDQVGNTGAASQLLTVTIDTEVTSPTLLPADNATDVLPTTDLVLTFAEDVLKSGNNISIRKSDDNSIIESFDVSSSKVTVSGSTVTIDLENTLPPATEVYVTIGQGAFVDQAGNDYVGINNTTDWSFTTIAASVVSSVAVPNNGTFGIGDELDFTVTMVLPVTVTGTPTIPITIGNNTVNASLVGTVSNSSTLLFRYTVVENDLDADGLVVGASINLNGGTMKDAFDVDAILSLNNVGVTGGVRIDGVRPTPTLSTTAANVVNAPFTVTFTYDEEVTDFVLSDISVSNGTAGNFVAVVAGTSWTAEITPTIAGDVIVSLAAGIANDLNGNSSAAGSTTVTRQFNNNPTDIDLSTTSIDENNALDATVATISTVDTDVGDSHTYTLVSGIGDTDNGTFTIDGASLKVNNTSFNFESGNTSFSVRIKTDDGVTGGTFEKAFTITVNDVNETPFNLQLSNNEIDESDNQVDVGIFSVMDFDTGDIFTYSLVSGAGDNNNLLFEINGTQLRTAGAVNFESNSTVSIRVRSTDSGGLFTEEVFSITINNVETEPLRDFTTNTPNARVTNVFTPNGDGTNDTWVIEDILDNPINEVKVYSQSGKLVFSQRNYENDWDGTFDGEPIPPGTYYYEINVYNGESIIRGFLTIIRD